MILKAIQIFQVGTYYVLYYVYLRNKYAALIDFTFQSFFLSIVL